MLQTQQPGPGPETPAAPVRSWSAVAAGVRRPVVAGCLLLALVVAAYLPALDAGFISDDSLYVTGEDRLETAVGLWRIWTEVGGPSYEHQYYPVTSSVFWLQHRLWGEHPFGYHLVNVLLHGIGAILLWRLLQVLAVPGAWLAGAIFAVHPVHVESVAWVSELKNVLSSLFLLAAALVLVRPLGLGASGAAACVLQPRQRTSPWREPSYWAGLLLFLLALLSKTATCLLPAALALMVWWKRGRLRREELLAIAPLALLGLAFVSMTLYLESRYGGLEGDLLSLSWLERLLVGLGLRGGLAALDAGRLDHERGFSRGPRRRPVATRPDLGGRRGHLARDRLPRRSARQPSHPRLPTTDPWPAP